KDQRPISIGPKANGPHTVPSAKVCQPAGCSCSTCILPRTTGGHATCVREEERTPTWVPNAGTRVAVSLYVFPLSLLLLLCFSMLPVARSQTKPGAPSAPPPTVSVIEVSPKALPLYTEYTGTTDSLDTVDIRARVDGY